MSPAATVLYTAVTFLDDDGVERYGYAQVPTDAARRRDLRRLGRARHARLGQPLDHLRRRRAPARGAAGRLPRRRRGRLHGAQPRRRPLPRLGVAGHRRGRRGGGRRDRLAARANPTRRRARLSAENVASSARRRATLAPAAHAGRRVTTRTRPRCSPRRSRRRPSSTRPPPRIVDRALALSGGAGYLSAHPLSRAYRDVRAGAFMHPLGANRAYDLLGDVALGRELVLH